MVVVLKLEVKTVAWMELKNTRLLYPVCQCKPHSYTQHGITCKDTDKFSVGAFGELVGLVLGSRDEGEN